MTQRYAIYLTPPPDHPLWAAGSDWLGRDARWTEPGCAPAGRRQAWRYGFHSTLKAPMRLAQGVREQDLWAALEALSARFAPLVELPPLQVAGLDGFLALRPTQPLPADHPLQELADSCVCELDDLRAPLTGEEINHRLCKAQLDVQQQALLARWGYPHVLQRWRWHYTLSDRLSDPAQCEALLAQAREHFEAALAQALSGDALSLFVEPAAGGALRLVHRFVLHGRGDRSKSCKIDAGAREHGAPILV